MVEMMPAFGQYRDPLQGRLFTTFRMTTLAMGFDLRNL